VQETVKRGISTYLVGVGTIGGGTIPEPQWTYGVVPAWAKGGPVHSVLDRASLQSIALASRGRYFELDREPDRDVALRIIQDVRGRSAHGLQEQTVDMYWVFLLGAAGVLGLALTFTRERVQLWWQAAGALAALAILVAITT
jgi:hypothetical protein